MATLKHIAICPGCNSENLTWSVNQVKCSDCQMSFERAGEFVDFIGDKIIDQIESSSTRLWGECLHRNPMAAPPHYVQIRQLFPLDWDHFLSGVVLEVGCGSGTDSIQISQYTDSIMVYSFDLGVNTKELSKTLSGQTNLRIFRANALHIPIKCESMDLVYSFGVFHHTGDPRRCFQEAKRVLKKKGAIFFYVYSAHEDIFIKRIGMQMEKLIMRLMRVLPITAQDILLKSLTVPCLLLFSWPAKLINWLGFENIAHKFPMYWGSTPRSLLPDLKDRLLSPVNHRFKMVDLNKMLVEVGFDGINLKKTASGIYGLCVK